VRERLGIPGKISDAKNKNEGWISGKGSQFDAGILNRKRRGGCTFDELRRAPRTGTNDRSVDWASADRGERNEGSMFILGRGTVV